MLGTEFEFEFADECASEFAAKGGSRLLSQSCGIHELCEFASECGIDFTTNFHIEFAFVKRPIYTSDLFIS
jgi:hypothetical protein